MTLRFSVWLTWIPVNKVMGANGPQNPLTMNSAAPKGRSLGGSRTVMADEFNDYLTHLKIAKSQKNDKRRRPRGRSGRVI